jgi:hypothetical protein
MNWRRLHNKEIRRLHRSVSIIRVIKCRRLIWAGYVVRMEEGRSTFKILTGKPTPLARLRCIYEENVRMDLKDILTGIIGMALKNLNH